MGSTNFASQTVITLAKMILLHRSSEPLWASNFTNITRPALKRIRNTGEIAALDSQVTTIDERNICEVTELFANCSLKDFDTKTRFRFVDKVWLERDFRKDSGLVVVSEGQCTFE